VVVLLQVTLGVLTVLGSAVHIPVDLAVAHQFGGMLLLESLFVMLYLLPSASLSSAPGDAVRAQARSASAGALQNR
jgi:cytochrome c oxidase assembly protein subunit 15